MYIDIDIYSRDGEGLTGTDRGYTKYALSVYSLSTAQQLRNHAFSRSKSPVLSTFSNGTSLRTVSNTFADELRVEMTPRICSRSAFLARSTLFKRMTLANWI